MFAISQLSKHSIYVWLFAAFQFVSTAAGLLTGVLGRSLALFYFVFDAVCLAFKVLNITLTSGIQTLLFMALVVGLLSQAYLHSCQAAPQQIVFQHPPAMMATPWPNVAMQITRPVLPQMIAQSVLALYPYS